MLKKLMHILGICHSMGYPMIIIADNNPEDHPNLKALAMIESGIDDTAKGHKGERSRYQIRQNVWEFYGETSFSVSNVENVDQATIVALKYIKNLVETFYQYNKRVPTEMETYAMWRLGFQGFLARDFDLLKCSPEIQDSCRRFANLVHLYSSQN